MKAKYLFTLSFLLFALTVKTQSFLPVDEGSVVKFKIKNFGLMVEGTLTGLQGKIEFDPANISASQFDVSVDANSIDTGIGMRDNHLRKEEYFDVKKYPRIRFVSSKITAAKNGQWIVTGQLTIKNVTKEISFPFSYSLTNGVPSFKGEFEINRRNYSVGGNSLSLSDNLTVMLSVATISK